LQFTSRDTAYVAGEQAAILRSVDGGETWEFLDHEWTSRVYALFFFSNEEGFFAGESSYLMYTLDGLFSYGLIRHGWGI